MVTTLRKVLVKKPDACYIVDDIKKWHYAALPDLKNAEAEHDAFVKILTDNGATVVYHTTDPKLPLADSIYVHDPALLTDKGAVILQMGKQLRNGEESELEKTFTSLGIPILGRFRDNATAEGGDMLWLDQNLLAVGRGYRTNAEGIKQLREILAPIGVTVFELHLPYFWGPEACLHLQSVISLVGKKKALVYLPLCPVPLIQYLNENGFTLIEAPQNEFEVTQATNVLCLGEGKVLALENNPVTKKRMEEAGIQVFTYQGNEISLKTEGGATCLTRPLLRYD